MIYILVFYMGAFLLVFSIILVLFSFRERKFRTSLIALMIFTIGVFTTYYGKNQLEKKREELERNIVKKEVREELKPIERERIIEALLWGMAGIVMFVTTAINMENYKRRILQKIKKENESDVI